jgi:hypothetical protein
MMTEANGLAKCLDVCDLALAGKPRLSAVFDAEWRAEFRRRVLSASPEGAVGCPQSYWLPVLARACPHDWPLQLQDRIETALDVVWNKVDDRSRSELIKRMREGDGLAAEEELLALFGFAEEFGRDAIRLPSVCPAKRKPEFFVDIGTSSFSVECKGLFDNEKIRKRDRTMLKTGQGWLEFHNPREPPPDRNRFKHAVVKKLKQAQGGKPSVLIMTAYTSWLPTRDVPAVVRRILRNPASAGLSAEDLPLALAWVFGRTLHGVELHAPSLAAAELNVLTGKRICAAIQRAFVPHADVRLSAANLAS